VLNPSDEQYHRVERIHYEITVLQVLIRLARHPVERVRTV
jgi:hypothetical protein